MSLGDSVLWLEAKHVLCFVDNCLTTVDVSLAGVNVNDIGVGVRHAADGFCGFADGDAITGADVDHFADGVVAGGGQQVRLDDVVYMDEVSGLFAVPLDSDIVITPRLVAEDADYAAVVAVLLTRVVSVEVSQCDGLDIVEFVVQLAVMVCTELFEPVRGCGCFGCSSSIGRYAGWP